MNKSKGRNVAIVSGVALLLLSLVIWNSWAEILFFIKFESLGPNEQGYREYRHRQTGIVFVSLPGGTFEMGSPEDEEGHEGKEGPVHKVMLSPFMIAKFEVTQEQWEDVIGLNLDSLGNLGGRPARKISWNDIQHFEAATGLGLPTEAQWEYACRAGVPGPFSGSGNLEDMGWYYHNSSDQPHPVGQKQPNQFGIHDMHGNVDEWCEDVYDGTFYAKDVPGFDPLSTTGSVFRVARGGGWGSDPQNCRSAARSGRNPSSRSNALGLRPAIRHLPAGRAPRTTAQSP